MDSPRFRESPFDEDSDRYFDSAPTNVTPTPECGPASELASPEGFQWIHDLIFELDEKLFGWDIVGCFFHTKLDEEGEPVDLVECADWRDALDTANRIEAVAKGLQCELLTAMPSDELMGDVCERLQPVISMLRKGLHWVRRAPLPPLAGILVWTPDQILADVKRAMRMAYEESHSGLREVAYKVAVRAAAVGLEPLNNSATKSSKPLVVMPPDADSISVAAESPHDEQQQQVPPPPKVYLSSWSEILAVLSTETDKVPIAKVRAAHKTIPGPIVMPKQGGQPKVVKAELLNWWEKLGDRYRELAAARDSVLADRSTTLENQYALGRGEHTETVITEIAGRVKRRRGST